MISSSILHMENRGYYNTRTETYASRKHITNTYTYLVTWKLQPQRNWEI